MNTLRTRILLPIVFLLFAFPQSAEADLLQHEVLLVWNSLEDPLVPSISEQVKDAYVAVYPNVNTFDLELAYTTTGYPITKDLVWPSKFNDDIRDRIMDHIANVATDTLCIVTTCGIPALVTKDFTLQPNSGHYYDHVNPGAHSRRFCSVEAMLALPDFEYEENAGYGGRYGYLSTLGLTFRDFRDAACLSSPQYLVSRLDAGGDTDAERLANTLAMINGSQNLTVSKFGVTIVLDGDGDFDEDDDPLSHFLFAGQACQYMRDARWCVYYDQTATFVHGKELGLMPCDENPGPCKQKCNQTVGGSFNCSTSTGCDCVECNEDFDSVEDEATEYPELAHFTLGANATSENYESTYEDVCAGYIKYMHAAEAGMLSTVESFNGRALWLTSVSNMKHGNILDWITEAGGSFALCNVWGPNLSDAADVSYPMVNFYEHGLTWAEAACTGLRSVVVTPIGDPLATVTVYDEDVDRDGDVDAYDYLDFLAAQEQEDCGGQPDCPYDINGDGFIDEHDEDLLLAVLPRLPQTGTISSSALPSGYDGSDCYYDFPLGTFCNLSLDGDSILDEDDLELIMMYEGCACTEYDFNDDGIVDEDDFDLFEGMFGTNKFDVDRNGIVECDDYFLVYSYSENAPAYLAEADLDCNSNVNPDDLRFWFQEWLFSGAYQPWADNEFDDDLLDLGCQFVRQLQNHVGSDPLVFPQYDVDSDGDIDCVDAGMAEIYWIHGGSQFGPYNDPCPNAGCEECN